MTREEISAAREIAEGKIREVLIALEAQTGCTVTKIYLTHHYLSPSQQRPFVMLDLDVGRLTAV